jgi:hypothetical protein
LDEEYSYYRNLLNNVTLYGDFLQNYLPGLTPAGKTASNAILNANR